MSSSRSLLEQLGLDEEEVEWHNLALCQNMKTEMWFDAYESDQEVAKAVEEVCLSCPVIKDCFFEGAAGQIGVWGGVYWNGSGKVDKSKNSHKSEEVWNRIQKKVS